MLTENQIDDSFCFKSPLTEKMVNKRKDHSVEKQQSHDIIDEWRNDHKNWTSDQCNEEDYQSIKPIKMSKGKEIENTGFKHTRPITLNMDVKDWILLISLFLVLMALFFTFVFGVIYLMSYLFSLTNTISIITIVILIFIIVGMIRESP